MVILANNSDKSIHRQDGIKYQKKLSSSLLAALFYKFGHNSAVFASIQK